MRENCTYGSAGGADLVRPDPDQRKIPRSCEAGRRPQFTWQGFRRSIDGERIVQMPNVTRNQWLLVLLVVLISHAALTIHSGTHPALDQQSCELCTQHANLSHAVPSTLSLTFDFGQDVPQFASLASTRPATATAPYHQRAPPRNA